MAAAELVLALTTWPAGAPLDELAGRLVADGLAACVTIMPAHRAVYRWQDAIERADEQQLIFKTSRERLAALAAAVHAAHPYDVPEWIVLGATGSEAYARWVNGSVTPGRGRA